MSSAQIPEKDCKHCFHRTGRITMARPYASIEERCCFCGKFQLVPQEPEPAGGNHGPFFTGFLKDVVGIDRKPVQILAETKGA